MLAYIWWHQREREETSEDYLAKLIAFHRLLQERQPPLFHSSYSRLLDLARLPWMAARLPWMAKEREVYEDWYLLASGVADPVDEVARRMIYSVLDVRQKPHQQAKHLAGNGIGQIYYGRGEGNCAVLDRAKLAEVRYATWFRCPSGMSHSRCDELLLRNKVTQQGMLWWRAATPLEFYLHSVEPPVLPKELQRESKQMKMNIIAQA